MDQKTMRELEAKCIQEDPPGCTTACPVHVDARALIAAVQKEDFKTGVNIFKRTVPFPRIISRICDQPCQSQCKRREIDAPIAINALERVCLDHGEMTADKAPPVPAKDKKVAVVGGGLSGLTVALELAQKGFKVVVFEKEPRLGGSVRHLPREKLPEALIEADLLPLTNNPLIEVKLNTPVAGLSQDHGPGSVLLADLCQQFDAVYLGLGPEDLSSPGWGLETDSQGNLLVHPLTLQTSRPRVFAGSSNSPVTAIARGKSAANSINRLVQNASLTANREKEGSYPTTLYTNIKGLTPQKEIVLPHPLDGYTVAEAVAEANRCLQCQCLECVKVCRYLAHYGSYPKRYVREIYNNLSIVMGIRRANKMINSCSLCGLCAKVCPNQLDMGEVCHEARKTMVTTNKMPPSAHDFALRDMQFSTSDIFVLGRHQPGFTSSEVLFFPGCQLSASKPHYVKKIYEFLCGRIAGGVGLSLGCCGAPAQWAGQTELFQATLENIKNEWQKLGSPPVITGCPTCYSIFKQEMTGVQVETLWTALDRLGLPEDEGGLVSPRPLAIHDACSTRYDRELQASIRSILAKLGHQVVELDLGRETTQCCGYGGLMSFANQEVAQKVRQSRVQENNADYLAYCAMCRDNYAREGKRVFHLLDLLYGGEQYTGAEKGPGFSRRQENRARLKTSFLKEVWGETVLEEKDSLHLIVPEQVQQVLEERMILEADIKEVIARAESTGDKFINTDENTFIACYKPVSVTYWVEYSQEGDSYRVHNAYCHRLEIEG